MQQAALQAQMQVAQAEQTKAAAQLENGRMKNEVDMIKIESSSRSRHFRGAAEGTEGVAGSGDQARRGAGQDGARTDQARSASPRADLSAQNEANKTPVKATGEASNTTSMAARRNDRQLGRAWLDEGHSKRAPWLTMCPSSSLPVGAGVGKITPATPARRVQRT